MRHTNIHCDAIQALARVDHRVAHVESNGRSRSERHTTRHVQKSYMYERRAPGFFFLPGGSLATFAIRGFAPEGYVYDSMLNSFEPNLANETT